MLLGLVVLVLAGVWVAVWQLRDTGAFVRASEELPDGPPVAIERNPASYRIVYHAQDWPGGERADRTMRLEVRRPFELRMETWQGPPPGEEIGIVRAVAFGRVMIGSGGQEAAVLGWPPSIPDDDLRLEGLIDEWVEDGEALRRERRQVGERACQVYRVGGSLAEGTFHPYDPDSDEYADVCIDSAGLLLEQVRVEADEVVDYRIAVEVEENPQIPDDRFPGDREIELSAEEGGGSVRELTSDSELPGRFWVLDEPPEGFEHRGRYAVIPPSPGEELGGQERPAVRASVTDVWVNGPEVLFLDRGTMLDGSEAFAPHPRGEEVDVGELGEGELAVEATRREIRVNHEGGRFVRVAGSLDASELVELARSVREVEGSGDLDGLLDEEP